MMLMGLKVLRLMVLMGLHAGKQLGYLSSSTSPKLIQGPRPHITAKVFPASFGNTWKPARSSSLLRCAWFLDASEGMKVIRAEDSQGNRALCRAAASRVELSNQWGICSSRVRQFMSGRLGVTRHSRQQ